MIDRPSDVSEETWTDWKAQRKARRSSITNTVIRGLRREGEKIGWSLEKVMIEVCERGWQGFKAEWVNETRIRTGQSKADAFYESFADSLPDIH